MIDRDIAGIEGLIYINGPVHEDPRGYFMQTFLKDMFEANNIPTEYVQENQSFSKKGVIRGLHFQPGQGKLVSCPMGRIIDVAVDIRPDSETYGRHAIMILEPDNSFFYIPDGFAHGFIALKDSIIQYKCTQYYNKENEDGIIYNDPTLNIPWDTYTMVFLDSFIEIRPKDYIISEKDKSLKNFIPKPKQ